MPNHLLLNTKQVMGYYLIAIVVLVSDQMTKFYFKNTFQLGESVEVISPILNWTLAHNYGAAFSFWQIKMAGKMVFAILGLIVSGFIIIYLKKHQNRQHPKLRLILGIRWCYW